MLYSAKNSKLSLLDLLGSNTRSGVPSLRTLLRPLYVVIRVVNVLRQSFYLVLLLQSKADIGALVLLVSFSSNPNYCIIVTNCCAPRFTTLGSTCLDLKTSRPTALGLEVLRSRQVERPFF